MTPTPILLKPAFVFTCSACGAETFAKTVPAELSPDERQELASEGLATEPGDWMTAPSVVECGECGMAFDVQPETAAGGQSNE